MRAAIGFALVTVCAAGTALAQQAPQNAAAEKHAVVFSATGGTSKGSYQGGNDWVISEFLRRQRGDSAFRVRAGIPEEWELKAVTGASAGNINALVTAMAWCTQSIDGRDIIPAEKSLLWEFWVGTGINELIPPDDRSNPEPAIFDRSFFIGSQQDKLTDFVTKAKVVSGCRIPVGITMTKQTPVELKLTQSGRETRVQRFAAVFELGTSADALSIEAPHESLAKGGLGALAFPPKDSECHGEYHGMKWAFNVMMASSSFPVAFAPRRVCYRAGGLVDDGEQRALFADGGVFDNNPAGLALGLADFRSGLEGRHLKPLDVFYTMGSNVRGPLRTARAATVPKQDLFGLFGTKQLLSGALTAAQEYEVQTLMRQVSRDKDLKIVERTVEFFPSSRSGEILGETLAGFGAFLAREFREYDFYSGIYDGLDFMAQYVCARIEKIEGRKGQCKSGSLVTKWIGENTLGLSEDALLVVKWRQALEQSPGVPMRIEDWASELNSPRQHMLFALHNQISNLAKRRDEIGRRRCDARNDMIGNQLCAGGFDTLLAGLQDDPRVKELRLRPGVDVALEELLERPKDRVNSLIEKAMNRLYLAEERLQHEQREYGSWVEMALLFYRGQSYRYRKGFNINPSSGQGPSTTFKSKVAAVTNLVAPNYVTLGMGGPSEKRPQYTLGWRPLVYRPWQGLYFGTVFEFSNLEDRRLQWRDNTYGVTIGSYAVTLPLMSSTELGLLRTRGFVDGGEFLASTTFRFVADKFHLNVRWKPAGNDEWFVNFGISDVNGMLYWLIR